MDLTTITDDCLEQLARGASVEQCLAHYPEAAEHLAPILAAAGQLRVLSQARLTEGQRLRAKVALREELATQRARRDQSRHVLGIVNWARLRVAPLATVVAVLLFVSAAFSAVAASQPGDLVYPVRVAVERAPALVQPNAARRAAAELAAADRRLSDIASDAAAHAVAVKALLTSDQAALERAQALGEAERAELAGRVTAHAQALDRLADEAADPVIATRLRMAADEALALVGRSKSIVVAPAPSATPTPTATPGAGASATRRATAAGGRAHLTATAPATSVVASLTAKPLEPTLTTTATATLRPRPRPNVTPAWSATPTGSATPTPTVRPTAGATQPRPTLSVVPPRHTSRPRPTLSVEPPTVVVPTVIVPTVIVPTVIVPTVRVPTVVIPSVTPGGGASVTTTTPTPTFWGPTATPTSIVPTRARPTVTVTPAKTVAPTATVVWATFTPGPTMTAQPEPPLTLTATAAISPHPTRTPAASHTPRRARTETPAPTATLLPTATPVVGGGAPAASNVSASQVMSAPPRPR